MINKKRIFPNIITAGNMFFGYLSIIETVKGNYTMSIWFIVLSMICDAFDGATARKLNAFSEFGKEFDSFCDVVSFGLAPSLLVYFILNEKISGAWFSIPISFVFVLCGIARLVRYNINTVASKTKDDFVGMPIPNAACMVSSYIWICYAIKENFGLETFNLQIFIVIIILASILMICTIPFKMPNETFNFIPKNKIFIFIFFVIVLLTLKYSLFIFCFSYVLFSIFEFFKKKLKKRL